MLAVVMVFGRGKGLTNGMAETILGLEGNAAAERLDHMYRREVDIPEEVTLRTGAGG